jgi:DNA-binding transcriptional ArsR family regulator
MSTANQLAEIGALIGDPARANMLSLLLDWGAHTATDLAVSARVSPQTASWNLSSLANGRLVTAEKRGRRRYHRLASPTVAQMLESVMTVAAVGPRRRRPTLGADAVLRTARTCYDHLAGRLGVALTEALVERGHVLLSHDGGQLTAAGADFLSSFGIALPAARCRKRIFCRPCLDWSERRAHLAGSVGEALAARCLALGWVEPMRGSRALRISPTGQRGFTDQFGIAF